MNPLRKLIILVKGLDDVHRVVRIRRFILLSISHYNRFVCFLSWWNCQKVCLTLNLVNTLAEIRSPGLHTAKINLISKADQQVGEANPTLVVYPKDP